MRPRRLVFALALPIALAAPALVSAADRPVNAIDFEFQPQRIRIDPGDRVVWDFQAAGHTTRSRRGQAESWDSGLETSAPGTTFEHTFRRPGRYQYFCVPHKRFMKGVVQVGEDRFRTSHRSVGQRLAGDSITISFRLVEPAKATLELAGRARRSVTRRRLARGRHSISVRGLAQGTYRGTLTFVDDFDRESRVRTRAVIR
jgi:plastocyanin